MGLGWGALHVGALLWHNRALNGANLQANTAVDTGSKVDPIPICSFCIFTRAFVNAGNRTRFNTVGYAFTGIRNNCMWHRSEILLEWLK